MCIDQNWLIVSGIENLSFEFYEIAWAYFFIFLQPHNIQHFVGFDFVVWSLLYSGHHHLVVSEHRINNVAIVVNVHDKPLIEPESKKHYRSS